jgi:hypothetical protein
LVDHLHDLLVLFLLSHHLAMVPQSSAKNLIYCAVHCITLNPICEVQRGRFDLDYNGWFECKLLPLYGETCVQKSGNKIKPQSPKQTLSITFGAPVFALFYRTTVLVALMCNNHHEHPIYIRYLWTDPIDESHKAPRLKHCPLAYLPTTLSFTKLVYSNNAI